MSLNAILRPGSRIKTSFLSYSIGKMLLTLKVAILRIIES